MKKNSMHKQLYCRYALAGLLLCLLAPAQCLIALSREPLNKVNLPSTTDHNERKTSSLSSADVFKKRTMLAGWYAPEVTLEVISAEEIELTLKDRSYDEARYEIHGADFTEVVTLPDSGQTFVYEHENIQPYRRYYYTVEAYLEGQDTPVYSETFYADTPLMAPEFLPYGVYYEENNIAFAMSGYRNRTGGIEIYRSLQRDAGYELIATVPYDQEEYFDANLKNNTTYFYKLRARVGDDVSELSGPQGFTTFAKNNPPTITARMFDEGTVEITFQDHSYNDLGYEIDNISPANPPFYQDFNAPDSGKVFVFYHYDVVPGSTYTYSVNVTTYGDGLPYYKNVAEATITVPNSESCTGTGSIEREVWRNIPGTSISSVPFDTEPTSTHSYTSFETPQYFANEYGSRMRGYVCVPATGNYTFWIASDDNSELWLSTDEDPLNKSKIASVTGYTGFRVWTKYTTQKSAPVFLVAGRRYYIEARHKEAGGNDHISVGWQLPDNTMERPIPGSRLVPFDEQAVSACFNDPNLGSIEREIWRNIPGTSVSSIPVNTTPSNVVTLESFQTGTYYANEYGSRIRGYLCVPADGVYTFWIASDDNSELWLSTNASPDNKVRIASVTGATRVGEWTKYPTQKSAPITLMFGYKYYVEVLHKEGGGNDHVGVGWQLPDGTMERPIPGIRLIAYEDEETLAARMNTEATNEMDPFDSKVLSLHPNPSTKREVTLNFEQEIPDLHQAEVEVVSVTGTVVHRQRLDCSGDCSDVLLSLRDNVPPGIYTVNLRTDRGRFSERLMLK
jgi:hypothetical protein